MTFSRCCEICLKESHNKRISYIYHGKETKYYQWFSCQAGHTWREKK